MRRARRADRGRLARRRHRPDRPTGSAARASRRSTTSPARSADSWTAGSAAASSRCRASRWAPTADARRPQREAPLAGVPRAAGHLRRPHRHAREAHAPGRRQVRAREPAEGGARRRGEAVRPLALHGEERRRLGRARSRRAPARRYDDGVARRAPAGVRADGRGAHGAQRRDARSDGARALSRHEVDRARPHRGQLVGHRRRGRDRPHGLGRVGQARRLEAAREDPRDGHRRRRAGDHADRARPGVAEGARAGRHAGEGRRSLGDQRGVRRRADARPRGRSASISIA